MRELDARDGMFGRYRVLERPDDGARLYYINDSLQTLMLKDGVSAFGYVHAASLFVSGAQNVLVIGGGGGSLATMLAKQGHTVTVIDIDPVAEHIARQFFSLPASVRWVTAEPLTFLSAGHATFDAVIVDACDAGGIVSPFDQPAVIVDLLKRACPRGSLIVNIVSEDGAPAWSGAMAAKLASLGLNVCLFRAEDGEEGNELLHVRLNGPADRFAITDLSQRPPDARTYLASLRAHVVSHALRADEARDARG